MPVCSSVGLTCARNQIFGGLERLGALGYGRHELELSEGLFFGGYKITLGKPYTLNLLFLRVD